ncbi:uncharacterized protein LOC127791670 [Diospyros lotus]|uniref:uncharacterized protein LOC127791670 n=1 Tax=Diospyros lotus TaxID=55363 RepID=UPI00224E03C6|nr:uncharacterized protein LOC127791670 [Diospyros lotus]
MTPRARAPYVTWEQFKELFDEKYMPIYEGDERIKAQKFLGGLNLRLQRALSSISTQSYAETVLQAITTEANLSRIESIQVERASHSFISHAIVEVLGEKSKNLNCRMIVATPMGKSLEISSRYKNRKIQIGEVEFLVDLILLEFQDFDVILGMNFLTKYNATLDCKAKTVSLKSGGSNVKFQGKKRASEKKWISALKDEKLLRQGAHAYLACVQGKNEEPLNIEEVRIVIEFRDVFPKELPGLPP